MASRCGAGIERSVTTDVGRGRASAAEAATGSAAADSATTATAIVSLRAFMAVVLRLTRIGERLGGSEDPKSILRPAWRQTRVQPQTSRHSINHPLIIESKTQ